MIQETESLKGLYRVPRPRMVQGRTDFVLDFCQGKKVLHLGCVDEGYMQEKIAEGSYLHTKLMKSCKEVWGVDISASGIEFLRSRGIPNLIVGDIEDLDSLSELANQHFDVILLTEVLEHLNNPGLFLNKARSLFKEDTVMIITVPNGLTIDQLKYTIKGYEYVHPDHNYWFSYMTLTTLLHKNGFKINELLIYSFNDCSKPIIDILMHKAKSLRMSGQSAVKKQANPTAGNMALNRAWNPNSRNPFIRYAFQARNIIDLLARKILYHQNVFLVADGLIAIVEPLPL